jgi:hypothetical protein
MKRRSGSKPLAHSSFFEKNGLSPGRISIAQAKVMSVRRGNDGA